MNRLWFNALIAASLPSVSFQDYILSSDNLFGYWRFENSLTNEKVGGVSLSVDTGSPTYVLGSLGQAFSPSLAQTLRYQSGSPTPIDPRLFSACFLMRIADPSLYTTRGLFRVYDYAGTNEGFWILTELTTGAGKNVSFTKTGSSGIVTDWSTHIDQWAMIGCAVNYLTLPCTMDIYVNGAHVGVSPLTQRVTTPTSVMISLDGDPSRQPNYPRRFDELAVWSDYKDAAHFNTLYAKWQDAV